MSKRLQTISMIIISLVAVSCANSRLNVRSSPLGADVFVVTSTNQEVKLGQTPLNIGASQVMSMGDESVQVLVTKKGFEKQLFVVPVVQFSSAVDINVRLNESKLPLACTQQSNAIDRAARQVAQAQFFVQQQRFDRALRVLLTFLDENPDSTVANDLLGNVYYLTKKSEKALEHYEKSLELEPNRSETLRMVQKLRTIVGTRRPSSSGGGR